MKTARLIIEVPCDRGVRVADVRAALLDILKPVGVVRSERPKGTLPDPDTRIVGRIDVAAATIKFDTRRPRRGVTGHGRLR